MTTRSPRIRNAFPWLIIPVETKSREFHAKLLLSCLAAEHGFAVILGNKVRIEQNMRFFPRGLVIGNNIVRNKIKLFKQYKYWGYRVAAWCEEGVAYRNRDTYRVERVSPEAAALIDRFFAWGPYHAEDIRLACSPELADRIKPSGSPRFDLLRSPYRDLYRSQAETYRKRFGRFFLINTNFHRFNHFMGRGAYLESLRKAGSLPTPAREEFARRWINYLGEMFGHFVNMIRAVSAAFPEHKIIVRPHPSEDHDAWRRELSDLRNVEVLFEGEAVAWIMASEVLIHNSCATGCEAYVLGIPAIAYRPIKSDEFDSYLPNAVSREVNSLEELVITIKNESIGGQSRSAPSASGAQAVAQACYGGLSGPYASENIVKNLLDLSIAPRPYASCWLRGVWNAAGLRFWSPIRSLLRLVFKGHNVFDPYIHQKFPSLELPEVQETIRSLARVSGRFSTIEVMRIGTQMFKITSNRQKQSKTA